MENITILSNDNFKSEVLDYSGTVLVDFWAEWCGPCKMLLPVVGAVAAEIGGKAKIAKLNVDDADVIASEYGIMTIPTLIIFKNGKEVEKVVGVRSKDQIMQMINRNL